MITRRHVETYFDATPSEQSEIWRAVGELKRTLDAELAPAGYNVGFNAHAAAGQTVMHLHVHVIPRYEGDVEDPRGGVRHVIPGKGSYLASDASTALPPSIELLAGGNSPLGPRLLADLDRALCADLAVAFVLPSAT